MKIKVVYTCEPVDEKFVIRDGERICRIIVSKHKIAECEYIPDPENKGKESGGFCHSGRY